MQQQLSTTNATAIFAGGCFWCTEAVFLQLKGVKKVQSGYIGGSIKNPTYEQICTGTTGHAEAINITFNPAEISYIDLLEIFFATHDATTLNQQGADIGTQYRSEIFVTTPTQKQEALDYIAQLQLLLPQKTIVTKVSSATTFYVAEQEHNNYYNNNANQSYCRYVIMPKINKVKQNYKDKIR